MFLLTLSLLALSGQTSTPAVDTPSAADKRMVCKRITRTGSRMSPKRVCLSAFEWRQTELRAQREVGDMKRQSRMEQQPVF